MVFYFRFQHNDNAGLAAEEDLVHAACDAFGELEYDPQEPLLRMNTHLMRRVFDDPHRPVNPDHYNSVAWQPLTEDAQLWLLMNIPTGVEVSE